MNYFLRHIISYGYNIAMMLIVPIVPTARCAGMGAGIYFLLYSPVRKYVPGGIPRLRRNIAIKALGLW